MVDSFNHNDYEITHRDVLYQGIFRLARYQLKHRLFNGEWSNLFSREILERNPAAAVLPYDPALDRVILIEQFRAGAVSDPKSPWLIEIPAGIVSAEKKPFETAEQEADEEAGCKLLKMELICEYFVSPGGSNEYLTLYCGKINASGIGGVHGLPEENEDIRVLNLTSSEAFAKLRSGQIKTAPALLALFWLQFHRSRLQETW